MIDYTPEKGYGFLRYSLYGEEKKIFAHHSQIICTGFRKLEADQEAPHAGATGIREDNAAGTRCNVEADRVSVMTESRYSNGQSRMATSRIAVRLADAGRVPRCASSWA